VTRPVRVRKKSLILRNVADAVAEADCKRTKGIYSTYSLISESVADDGRGPLITYKWNSGLIQIYPGHIFTGGDHGGVEE
jgi:hypothetical protein